jgi:hypothetical protein
LKPLRTGGPTPPFRPGEPLHAGSWGPSRAPLRPNKPLCLPTACVGTLNDDPAGKPPGAALVGVRRDYKTAEQLREQAKTSPSKQTPPVIDASKPSRVPDIPQGHSHFMPLKDYNMGGSFGNPAKTSSSKQIPPIIEVLEPSRVPSAPLGPIKPLLLCDAVVDNPEFLGPPEEWFVRTGFVGSYAVGMVNRWTQPIQDYHIIKNNEKTVSNTLQASCNCS